MKNKHFAIRSNVLKRLEEDKIMCIRNERDKSIKIWAHEVTAKTTEINSHSIHLSLSFHASDPPSLKTPFLSTNGRDIKEMWLHFVKWVPVNHKSWRRSCYMYKYIEIQVGQCRECPLSNFTHISIHLRRMHTKIEPRTIKSVQPELCVAPWTKVNKFRVFFCILSF